MPRTDRDGRTVRLSVSQLLGRPVRDGEIASALQLPISTYNRRKRRSDFPSFGELRQIAHRLRVDEMVLQVDFGYIDVANLNTELQQRYAAYRNAVDVMASMHGTTLGGGIGTQDVAAGQSQRRDWMVKIPAPRLGHNL